MHSCGVVDLFERSVRGSRVADLSKTMEQILRKETDFSKEKKETLLFDF
jgi:hypothetical protein